MTNGEKFKSIFSNIDSLDTETGIMIVKWADNTTKFFKTSWWNAEYKEPTTKNDLGVELISKEQTIDRVLTYFNHIDKGCDDEWAKGYEAGAEDAIAVIKSMPSVTPQEPKTGHWISTETKGIRYAFWCRYKCSLCGGLSDHTTFCPNCGAKMVEPQESEDNK